MLDVLSLFTEAGAWALLAVLLLLGGYKLFLKMTDDRTKMVEDHKAFVAEVMKENQGRETRLLDCLDVYGTKMGEIVSCFESLKTDMSDVKLKLQDVSNRTEGSQSRG